MMSEYRPYMRLVNILASLYKDQKLYHKASQLLEPLYSNEEKHGTDGMGIRYSLTSIYTLSFDYTKLIDLCQRQEELDDMLLINLLISSILAGEDDAAKKALDQLAQYNPWFISVFRDDEWPADAINQCKDMTGGYYKPSSIEPILIQLKELWPILENDSYTFDWIKDNILNDKKLSAILQEFPDNYQTNLYRVSFLLGRHSQTYIELANSILKEYESSLPYIKGEHLYTRHLVEEMTRYEEEKNRVYDQDLVDLGLKRSQLENLSDLGLDNIDDLKKLTKKEFPSVRGIGAKTVEKLEEKGFSFKDE